MTRFRRTTLVAGLVCALGVGLTVLRASDAPAPAPQDQITKLLARVESLEKRIASLEADREQATRQASAHADAPTPLLPVPRNKGQDSPKTNDSPRPAARIFLLKQTQPEKP